MIVGITIITVSILVNQVTKETFSKNNPGLDAVVGAKGSPLQLNIQPLRVQYQFHWEIISKILE